MLTLVVGDDHGLATVKEAATRGCCAAEGAVGCSAKQGGGWGCSHGRHAHGRKARQRGCLHGGGHDGEGEHGGREEGLAAWWTVRRSREESLRTGLQKEVLCTECGGVGEVLQEGYRPCKGGHGARLCFAYRGKKKKKSLRLE